MELIASFPPLNIAALPLFIQSVAASTVTLGRDSNIIPITPIGTLTLVIFIPLGRVNPSITSPTGSLSDVSCIHASAIPSIRSFVSLNLSVIASDMPLSFAAAISLAFSSRMMFTLALNTSAIFLSISSFFAVPADAILLFASFALIPNSSMYPMIISFSF